MNEEVEYTADSENGRHFIIPDTVPKKQRGQYGYKGERYHSPVKAIRAYCLDCTGNMAETEYCQAFTCPLFPYRFGKNPFSKDKVMSEERREAAVKRLAEMRAKRKSEE